MLKRSLWTALFIALLATIITVISKQFGWDPNRGYFIIILTFIVDIYGKLDDIRYCDDE